VLHSLPCTGVVSNPEVLCWVLLQKGREGRKGGREGKRKNEKEKRVEGKGRSVYNQYIIIFNTWVFYVSCCLQKGCALPLNPHYCKVTFSVAI